MALIDWNSVPGKKVIHALLKELAILRDPNRPVSLGWVNVYKDGKRYRISSLPYKTKELAQSSRASNPVSVYVDTVEVFAKVNPL